MTNGNDSDLDEYQQKDNLESYRAPEFQPPLSDVDVFIADSLVSAPAGTSNTTISPQGQTVAPSHEDSLVTNSTAEAPPSGSASVGAPDPRITVSMADTDSLLGLPTLDVVPTSDLTYEPLLSYYPLYTDKELLDGTLSPTLGPLGTSSSAPPPAVLSPTSVTLEPSSPPKEGGSLHHLPTLPTLPLIHPLDPSSFTDKEHQAGTTSPRWVHG